MNFQDLLAEHVAAAPQRIAFYDEQTAWTYEALDREADRVARLLHAAGAHEGDRLALWMPNAISWLAIFLGCARLGITVVAVNTRFRENEVSQLLELGRCQWLAVWPEFKRLPFADILASIDACILRRLRGILAIGPAEELHMRIREVPLMFYEATPELASLKGVAPAVDTAGAIVYTTSGTTSAPKLVLHSQSGLIAHGTAAALAYGIEGASVVLLAAPLCGAFGFSTAVSSLAAGATLVSSPVFQAEQTVRQIVDRRVSHTFANNELIDLLLREVKGQAHPFPSLQYVGFASFAPALDDLQERALRAGLPIAGLYGSSELQALVAGHRLDTPWEHRRLPGGALVSPEARVRSVDLETGRTLPHHMPGLIEIRAPSLMDEYLGNLEATRQAFSDDGYFRTGDLGFTLDDRTFLFQGRKGDYLRLGGFLVNPMEIESFIEGLDGVQACQVVGAEHLGKLVPVAFVVPKEACEVSESAIIEHCRQSMARFKVPQRVIGIESFPVVRSANSNKIQRSRLQQMAAELLGCAPPTCNDIRP